MKQKYTMSQPQLDTLLESMRARPLIALNCGVAASQQESANNAWATLGIAMGFDSTTVEATNTGNQLEFYAEPTEPNNIRREPTIEYTALHSQVLVVAVHRAEGGFKAYCTPVPGMLHKREYYLWERDGVEVSERVARACFPHLQDLPYAR
jgi:hypothetical protein